jgi:hypothetical protein
MKLKIVGIQKNEFNATNRQTGEKTEEVIKGFNVFVLQERNGVDGHVGNRIYLSEKKVRENGELALGMVIDAEYNEYGKIEAYDIVTAPKAS